jgi:ATP-dependent helicase/nuclease subunit B
VQARFILGPAGSGKTFRCLAEVRTTLKNDPEGKPLIFLAPKQATFQIERQLLADDSFNGYARLHIFSFERLARFILDELGVIPPKFLNDEGRVMVLRALLMRHADELKLFRSSARRPGFAQELGHLLNELQQHQLTPVKLRSLAHREDLSSDLHAKLHDLALLSENYADWLRDHALQDENHLLDFATEMLRSTFAVRSSAFAIDSLWLDGFAEMTPQELDLLAAILPACDRATLAFCLDHSSVESREDSWLSIWSTVGKSFQQCRERIENLADGELIIEILARGSEKNRFVKSPELARLEARWSLSRMIDEQTESAIGNRQSAISLVACLNAEAEAIFAAREILKFIRSGNRFRDCAVLVRNLDAYHHPLARVFHRYEIPFFLDRRESVTHHPLAELTRGALHTITNEWKNNEDWFATLKTGFCPVTAEKIDDLENLALEFGWRGRKWREPLPLENRERLREIIFPPFETFSNRLAKTNSKPDGEQLAAALRALWSDLNVQATLEHWMLDEEKLSSTIRHSSPHQTVWNQMNDWLDNVALAFSHNPLPLREWLPILEAGLANLTVGVIPPALDQVLIGAVDRARNPELKFVLVLGMNETVFPAAPAAQIILTAADRDELGHSVSLGPDLRERLAHERYYGYIACTRASEKLVATFSRHTADGQSLNPSPFVAHLKQIFPELETRKFGGEIKLADAEHASDIIVPLLEFCSSGRESAHPEKPSRLTSAATDGWQKLLELPPLKLLAESLGALREPEPTENLSPAFAEKLYSLTLRTSVSRLEEFAACPFRFFVRSGLRAGERKVFELDARERGSFQHDVLKTFHDQLTAEGNRWRDLAPADARARVGKIAAGQTEHYRDGLLRDTAESRFAARMLAESLQDFVEILVTWLREQNEFDPSAAELGFGGKDDRVPAWEINLGDGHKLSLHGRIDRVDLWCDPTGGDALALVLDYKSSSKKLDRLLVENGVQLQLLAYLNVLRHWKNPQEVFGVNRLVPAGVFYVNLRGEYKGGGTREEVLADADEARRKAYRHTGRFDAGVLDRLDRIGAADQFNYRRNSDGSLRKGSVEAMPRAEFDKLLDGVELQLREMGKRIFSGGAQVDPYRKGKQTPCDFCDYQAVCRIDKWTHQYRVLRAASEPGG